MRLFLHPAGLLRFGNRKIGKKPVAEGYEVTPFGRKPVRPGWARAKLLATVVGAVGAGAVVWMLI